MKKMLTLLAMVSLLLVGVVSASTTTLSDTSLSMAYEDVREVEFCLSGTGAGVIDVVVTNVCKDQNGLYGCQAADDFDVEDLFTVVPNQPTMADGECIMVTLTTTIEDETMAGQFYYTINGAIGEAFIGSETGTVLVPEFGVVAGLAVLAGAGLFLYKRRA